MPATRARQPRRRKSHRGSAVPTSMVRCAAYAPSPPLPTPSGTNSIAIHCSDPVMPTGASLIQVIEIGTGEGVLAPVVSVVLLDPQTIQVIYDDALAVGGVYIPYNDPGFRGINGGMLNPGELSAFETYPRPFPWCCALG